MSHQHHSPFCLQQQRYLKMLHFNNTSHFHLLLYSYYYWFKPLIVPLCVCFTCSFLTQIPPITYLFSKTAFIYSPKQGGVFWKLIWVSLYSGTVLWQTWLNSLQIPSLLSCLNDFPPHWCVNIWLCEISLLKDKEFIWYGLSPYFMFTQWMWPKLCCWYLKLLQHPHSVNEFSLSAKMRHDVDVPAGSSLSVRKLPSGDFRNSGGLKFPLFTVQNKPPHSDKCRVCCKQFWYVVK